MKFLTILLFVSFGTFAQSANKPDTTKVYDLGPAYEGLLQHLRDLKKQHEQSEAKKEPFILGYLAGRDRLLSEQDSLVWIDSRRFKIVKKKK